MKKLFIALIVLIAALCCLLPFVPKELFVENSKSTYDSSVIISYDEINEQKEDSSVTVSYSDNSTEIADKTYNCTRDELISKGYSTCKHCCP